MSPSASDCPSPAKRPRVDSKPTNTFPFLIRSQIWKPYGDIILQAESTQFRVNRDILATHSVVFADLFSLPQPPGGNTVEGCSIVELSDSAKDIELMLSAFYDPYHNRPKQSIDILGCMLRLGRKYDIVSLKNDALNRIHRGFPATLSAFDKCMNAKYPGSARFKFGGVELVPGLLIELLNLAYENGLYTSIPVIALQCLATYSLEILFSGVERDGTRITLPDSVKLTLALALERIQLFQVQNLEWLTDDSVLPSSYCQECPSCSQARDVMGHIDCRESQLDVTHLVHPWMLVGEGRFHDVLCEPCEKAARAEYNAGRTKAWEKLPTFFGLPEWKDLKDTY